jgi:DNA repair exonuclease SbcCD ATPase subunit
MPIQPLEIYDVEETGELVLKHKDLKDALITSNTVMIVNHEDKSIILWIGKGSSTRIKFAAARASRRFLTERGLSYRVKTADEGEEPDWFQALFTMKVTERSRDEPPTLEILSILNEMKAVKVPEGFEREACIVSRDFYVPVEYKTSVMGTETSSIKFEKGSYLPEGFFMLPSGTYCPRLLVKSGKVLGIDILINQEIAKKFAPAESLQQEGTKSPNQFESLQDTINRKDEEIKALREEISENDDRIKSIQANATEKDTLQDTIKQKDEEIKALIEEVSKNDKLIKSIQANATEKDALQDTIKRKDEGIKALIEEVAKKDDRIKSIQANATEKDTLQDTIKRKDE